MGTRLDCCAPYVQLFVTTTYSNELVALVSIVAPMILFAISSIKSSSIYSHCCVHFSREYGNRDGRSQRYMLFRTCRETRYS